MVHHIEVGGRISDQISQFVIRSIPLHLIHQIIFFLVTNVPTGRLDDEVHLLQISLEHYFDVRGALLEKVEGELQLVLQLLNFLLEAATHIVERDYKEVDVEGVGQLLIKSQRGDPPHQGVYTTGPDALQGEPVAGMEVAEQLLSQLVDEHPEIHVTHQELDVGGPVVALEHRNHELDALLYHLVECSHLLVQVLEHTQLGDIHEFVVEKILHEICHLRFEELLLVLQTRPLNGIYQKVQNLLYQLCELGIHHLHQTPKFEDCITNKIDLIDNHLIFWS